jgi:two-component system sensor histidine kinase CpxA
MIHTDDPPGYWALTLLPQQLLDPSRKPFILIIQSETLGGGGVFFDWKPWALTLTATLFVTFLVWFPFARNVTRSIAQITQVADEMADGRFEVKADETRRDELGLLGRSINRMNARISGFVTGQKRFLGDVAHELCAPLSRAQLILGILERKAERNETVCYTDLKEEIDQISDLVNELLSFSKTGLTGKENHLVPVDLSDLITRVIRREKGAEHSVEVRIAKCLSVQANHDLLARALSNLLRNAIRYAGDKGKTNVSAETREGWVELRVSDEGPGVPEEDLERIFDPFFRVENSRSRETGGVGLGLSIVKTCVQACGGKISARNRKPSGLEVVILLRNA